MKRIVGTIVSVGLLLGALLVMMPVQADPAYTGRMGLGADAASIAAQTAAGVKPDYGMLWIGPWTLATGWGGPNDSLAAMRNAGVTPVIQFYYWGDDISRSCFENGCWSPIHGVEKNQDEWNRLARQLVRNLDAQMGGATVIIVLETEFNQGDIQTYKPFDRALADMTDQLRAGYANAKIVLGLGNWNPWYWSTWTASAGKSDYVGIQGMRGSTRDSLSSYLSLYEATLAGARKAQELFRKPVFLTDIALSSYPASSHEAHQAAALAKFFTGMATLKQAGVEAMMYRAWFDSPQKDTNNYYGQAERHFGLVKPASGEWKNAASVWIDGVQTERSTTALDARFTVSPRWNEWWVEVWVDANKPLSRVEFRVDGGPWTPLAETAWGSWARVHNVPRGDEVQFRAVATDGDRKNSDRVLWLGPAFTADFAPRSQSNPWWVEVKVEGTERIVQVEACERSGSCQRLSATSWGTHAASFHAPAGTELRFRATGAFGVTATSGWYTWG